MGETGPQSGLSIWVHSIKLSLNKGKIKFKKNKAQLGEKQMLEMLMLLLT